METRNAQSEDKFVVRLPDGMRDELKAAARENNRSMNAEIVSRLSGRPSDAATDASGVSLSNLQTLIAALTEQIIGLRAELTSRAAFDDRR